jgi:hypothetical protein
LSFANNLGLNHPGIGALICALNRFWLTQSIYLVHRCPSAWSIRIGTTRQASAVLAFRELP